MNTNTDTSAHLALNSWLFKSNIDMISDIIKAAAIRLKPELRSMLSTGLPAGTSLAIEQSEADSLARKLLIDILFATLDAELVRTEIGESLNNKLLLVSDALELPRSRISRRELSSTDLLQIFGGLGPFKD
ncbi:hypothetical protein M5C97_21980 [Acidovorax sp. NCPPB 3859]|nr:MULTISPECIES: hypothetical protein [unclassified Acidovorax]MDA8452297.1 hypothetical protein [Acidovorax sp. GBBC 3297]MDA8461743.1 hypothetical protein [Acidovorax sp. GBBC 3333]MDA8466776.1 hypothetical protein [Acidovorax sp. GBBC 3332]MDA8471810.1 hypothetical protein [Acidovorax sp. GBBC 3299]WCM78138.1 hypothetical protein M5C94_21925 [Acidovorax sp. GBBC 712]